MSYNIQHFLTAQHFAKERGFVLLEPEQEEGGWKVMAWELEGAHAPSKRVAHASTADLAIQRCLDIL
jgi:hypothetical protein